MEFASFVIYFLIACTLSAVLLGISSLLGQKRKLVRENDMYESGVNAVGSATRQYDIKFFLTAILFLLFDVEIVFLLPWAMAYKDAPSQGFMIYGFVFFMVILLVGYIFVINSKALKWEE
jgi:NADH-quinone oxidoreductase subunit A